MSEQRAPVPGWPPPRLPRRSHRAQVVIVILWLLLGGTVAWLGLLSLGLLAMVSIGADVDPEETRVIFQWFLPWVLGALWLSVALWWTYRRTKPQ